MTKYLNDKYGSGNSKDTPIVVDESWTRIPKHEREVYCKWCHHLLHTTRDYGSNNINLYCSNCKISYDDTEDDDLRSKNKIANPERIDNSKDPAVAYPPDADAPIKRKKNEPRGTFKVLRDRGMNITNYSEKGWRKTTYE